MLAGAYAERDRLSHDGSLPEAVVEDSSPSAKYHKGDARAEEARIALPARVSATVLYSR